MTDFDSPTPRQVKAARALLAWTQTQLAKEAGIAISTLADFERGERTPVANNAQAIAAALMRQGITFTRGGAVTGPPGRNPAGAPATGGSVLRWITAQNLAEWAGRRDGQAGLPELISRLVVVGCGPVALRFPSDDSIVHPGWDGIVETPVATAFVPEGVSVWELGAQRERIERKAEEDYRKRTADPLGVEPASATYVFVTPHRWPHKDEWAAARFAEGVWKDVRAIDGDTLVHWLERHAGVAEWLAVRIGRRPAGLRNLPEVWDEWSLATRPPLTPEIASADRDEEVVRVLQWLDAEPSLLAIQAEAVDEAIAFLYAAVNQLPDPQRLFWMSRILVADTEAVAREIGGLSEKMVIVLTAGDPGLAARLARDGHHVFAAYGSDVGAPANVLRLPRAWRHTIEVALADAGLEGTEARRYASAAGRSLAVLRRLMPAAPARRPGWAQLPLSPVLLGTMLAGAWDRDHPVDQAIVARLCGVSYEAVEQELAPLAATLDGPVRRSGPVWKLTSLRDTWFLLAAHLTTAQVETLMAAFLEVLGGVSPRYEDPDFRLRLDRGPPAQASLELRRGLSEAVIALGVWPDRATGVEGAAHRSERAVADLLGSADDARWWSLANDFRRLAEAAPDAFLNAIERALGCEPSPMASLFRSDEGFMHANEYLADLLWSLEILCWSPDHVGRATLILARLAAVDPGGRISNRPKETLARIFLPWRPQTFASPSERIQQIDLILRRWPEVGWNLLHAISPNIGGGITRPTSKPLWRDFSTDAPEVITNRSLHEMYDAIGDRLLEAAAGDRGRWEIVLGHWPSFGPEWRARAHQRLKVVAASFGEDDRQAFRETLRLFIAKHARFPEAHWSLDREDLAPIEEIFTDLEPISSTARNAWLFGLANPRFDTALSWQQAQERLEAEQIAAVEEMEPGLSDVAFVDFATTVERSDALGAAIALSTIAEDRKEAILREALNRIPGDAARFAQGLLYGLKRREGESAIQLRLTDAIAHRRPAEEIVAIAFTLEAVSGIWTLVASAGDEVDRRYWTRLNLHFVPESENVEVVVAKALAVQRGRAALSYIAGHEKLAASPELIERVMRDASTISGAGNEADDNDGGMFGWYVGKMFERLDAIDGLQQEVASLEWIYFEALRHSERPPRALYRLLSEDPDFFVMLLKSLYGPSGGDEPELSGEALDQARTVATQAFHVLEEWTRIPGSDDDGRIDAAKLAAWVKGARAGAAAAHRLEMADYRIGVILSAAHRTADEPWPPEPIRDVLEDVANDAIDEGFAIGRFNRRGVTTRMPNDGGGQERSLAGQYRADAKASSLLWPRTRAVLERMAKGYEADAEREDQSAEQRDW